MTITLTSDEAQQVPLIEQLESVPEDARLCIDDADGMGTHYFPIGRMCHEAAKSLRAKLSAPEPEPVAGYRWEEGRTPPSVTFTSPPQREWIGLTVDEFYDLDDVGRKMILEYGRLVEAKLREKNA